MNSADGITPRAVFVVGILTRPSRKGRELLELLDERYGRRYLDVPAYDFDFTDYYEDEHGSPLERRWYVYQNPFDPGELAARKRESMALEDRFRDEHNQRLYNIDVGYVTGSTFVLASRKNHSHRIYLGDGVYGEATMRFEGGEWRESPNAYPEFTTDRDLGWLLKAREYWLEKRGEQQNGQSDDL